MTSWIGTQRIAVVPTFNTQFDPAPPPGWASQVMRRVLYDPDPDSGIDRSLRGYIEAISYGRASLEVEIFPFAYANGPQVVEAAYQSLPAGHNCPYVLCVIPLYDGDINRKGWFRSVNDNGVLAVSRVAMFETDVRTRRQITGVWAMELLHAVAGLPDLYLVTPNMGDFDNMTYNAGTHSCAWLKVAAGWLSAGDTEVVPLGGSDHDLHSIGVSPPPPGRTSAAIVTGHTSGHQFYVEGRRRSDVYERGFATLPNGSLEFRGIPAEGVIIYETSGSNRLDLTYLRGFIKVGETYDNPTEGFTVSVTEAITDGFAVHVTRTPNPQCPAILGQISELRAQEQAETEPDVKKQLAKRIWELEQESIRLGCV